MDLWCFHYCCSARVLHSSVFVSHTCCVMTTASLSPRSLLILPQCSVTPLRPGTARLQDTGFRDNKFSKVCCLASFNRWCQSGSHNTIRVTAWLGHTVQCGQGGCGQILQGGSPKLPIMDYNPCLVHCLLPVRLFHSATSSLSWHCAAGIAQQPEDRG